VFQTPWQNIVGSMETMAESHATLAHKIETDIEAPLRSYSTKNREMTGMATIQGNLASLAKDLEEAQKKSNKLKAKGGKADTSKVSNAVSGVQESSQQWDSQAPFVFEQLQSLDESRVNHLRDLLTQLETHELDQLERSRVSAEGCLNVLLNVDTSEEISTFVAKMSGGMSTTRQRRQSRVGSTGAPASPVPAIPPVNSMPLPRTPVSSYDAPATLTLPNTNTSRSVDDGRSERSAASAGAMMPPQGKVLFVLLRVG
jgi:hypothetical protein